MSVAPTSAAAALASQAASTERASKVQTTAKEADKQRRVKHGQQTGDRVVLSTEAVQPKQSATERSEADPHEQAVPSDDVRHIDVEG
ncbi:hypothetical protein AY599_04790 [Leptolyngbya valderiana BDU 20041]|nr:hypothetical protein AY599_04790 [Leptolyngbya valderiana BDU 20041]